MTSSLYEVLGVAAGATDDEIKRAYRKLASRHHPDRKGGCNETMQRVQNAYDVLSDKERREQYDRGGGTEKKPPLDDMAMDFIAQGFSQYIEAMAHGKATDSCPLEEVRHALKTAVKECNSIIKTASDNKNRLLKKSQSVKRKTDGVNLFSEIVTKYCEKMDQAKLHGEGRLQVFTRALELLEQYENQDSKADLMDRMYATTYTGGGFRRNPFADWSST